MFHVRLRPDWKGTFRRTIARDEKGKSTAQREFTPGEVVQIPAVELPFLAFDIGKALQPMEWSTEFNKFRPIDLADLDLDTVVDQIKAGKYKEPDPPVIEAHAGGFVLVEYAHDEPSYLGQSGRWSDKEPEDPFPTEDEAQQALNLIIARG